MRAAMRQIRLLTPSRAALAARCALSTTAAGTSVPPPSTSATARPTTTADAVVIGSGVIGTAVALGLARRGYTVRCVERMREAGLGTTSYSSGIIRTCYTALDSCKFAWEGTHYWSDWEAFVGGGGSTDDGRGFARYRECGGMIPLTESSEAFVDNCLRHYDTLGIPYVEEKKRDERGQRLTMCGIYPVWYVLCACAVCRIYVRTQVVHVGREEKRGDQRFIVCEPTLSLCAVVPCAVCSVLCSVRCVSHIGITSYTDVPSAYRR